MRIHRYHSLVTRSSILPSPLSLRLCGVPIAVRDTDWQDESLVSSSWHGYVEVSMTFDYRGKERLTTARRCTTNTANGHRKHARHCCRSRLSRGFNRRGTEREEERLCERRRTLLSRTENSNCRKCAPCSPTSFSFAPFRSGPPRSFEDSRSMRLRWGARGAWGAR